MTERPALLPIEIVPIGVVRTPFEEKASAPRQSRAALGVAGRVELERGRGFDHALRGIEDWSHLWVLYCFHLNRGPAPRTVRPPRSKDKKGVFATRSPHRPNGIGMSVVRLERVEGLALHVLDVDMVDMTPVLDIKPYVPYADAVAGASSGWLESPADPGPRYEVAWAETALAQRAFLRARGEDVGPAVETILGAGPEPHPYRRIRPAGDGSMRLALKAWRYRFRVDGARVLVESIATGYQPRQLATERSVELDLHREFVERFG